MSKFLSVILFLSFLVVFPFAVFAKDQAQKIVTVSRDQVINEDFFANGDRVEILGTINGDVFVAGGQVIVEGTINGDLWVVGGEIDVSGTVSDDVKIAGGQIVVSGRIGKDLITAGGNTDIKSTASIGEDLASAGGNIDLAAPVAEDARFAGGNAVIRSTVGGDVQAAVGNLRLDSGARIGDDLSLLSGQPVLISEGARVEGNINQQFPPPRVRDEEAKRFISTASIFWIAMNFVTSLIIGLVIISLFPKFIQTTLKTLVERPWASLGMGIILLILVPVLIILLLVTVLGIPLALVLLFLYLAALYISRIFVILWAGERVVNLFGRRVVLGWALFVGLIVYYLISFIPLLSGLVSLFVLLFGLGVGFLSLRRAYAKS